MQVFGRRSPSACRASSMRRGCSVITMTTLDQGGVTPIRLMLAPLFAFAMLTAVGGARMKAAKTPGVISPTPRALSPRSTCHQPVSLCSSTPPTPAAWGIMESSQVTTPGTGQLRRRALACRKLLKISACNGYRSPFNRPTIAWTSPAVYTALHYLSGIAGSAYGRSGHVCLSSGNGCVVCVRTIRPEIRSDCGRRDRLLRDSAGSHQPFTLQHYISAVTACPFPRFRAGGQAAVCPIGSV